jgi:hypothetical protein
VSITLVCGFGRCGSSLTMQMLAAGGMPVLGEHPAYEVSGALATAPSGNRLQAAFLERCEGQALKLLDPHRFLLPRRDYRVLWLSRDYHEQARSQAKFAHLMFGVPVNRKMVRGLEQSYPKDKPKAFHTLIEAGATICEIRFEALIDPNKCDAVERLAEFCGGLDVDAMRAIVVPRPPEAQPGLDMELMLMRRRVA